MPAEGRTVNDRLASLLPQPTSVRPRPGSLALGGRASVAAGPGAASAAAAVRRALASWPWPDDPGPARPDGPPDGPPGGPPGPEITVETDPARPAEGYRLDIGPGRIRIAAGGAAGAFYAAQTLRQLLPDDAWRAAPVPGPAWSVPQGEIEDAPALSWRGAHLDVARHFFPKREVLTIIDSPRGPQAEPVPPASHRRPGLADREPQLPRAARDRRAPDPVADQPRRRTARRLRRDAARRLLHPCRPGRDRCLRGPADGDRRARDRGPRSRHGPARGGPGTRCRRRRGA